MKLASGVCGVVAMGEFMMSRSSQAHYGINYHGMGANGETALQAGHCHFGADRKDQREKPLSCELPGGIRQFLWLGSG
ncbi:hypothetical protein [Pollutimonas bauzanensis]|uniref:hypothetical protein n=1 Tax=Pollutimonas bauzanensis TaxID=658167 RepID=UPI0015B47C7E|nr:hypothetical protein [Pollutimonas bauzanensis]